MLTRYIKRRDQQKQGATNAPRNKKIMTTRLALIQTQPQTYRSEPISLTRSQKEIVATIASLDGLGSQVYESRDIRFIQVNRTVVDIYLKDGGKIPVSKEFFKSFNTNYNHRSYAIAA